MIDIRLNALISCTAQPTPMTWSSDIHVAPIGGDLVFLQADIGRYALAPNALRPAPTDDGSDMLIDRLEPELARELSERGWLISGPPGRNVTDRYTSPRSDLSDKGQPRASLRDIVGVIACGLWATWRIATASFSELVFETDNRAGCGIDPSRGSDPSMIRHALVFAAVLPWVPLQGVCLYRALALQRYLRHRGHCVQWVFGVRAWPFSAHCWLQAGEVVINDRLERVRDYTVIMVTSASP